MNKIFTTFKELDDYIDHNNITPPDGSNTYFDFENGIVDIATTIISVMKMGINIDEGIIDSGDIIITIHDSPLDVDMSDYTENKYSYLTICDNTEFILRKGLVSYSANITINGKLTIDDLSTISLFGESYLNVTKYATIAIGKGCIFEVSPKAEIFISGTVNIDVEDLDRFLMIEGLVIDATAVFNVSGVDRTDRVKTLAEYEQSLRDDIIVAYSQGYINTEIGQLGYSWIGGTPDNNSYIIDINIINGDIVLGDLDVNILGRTLESIPDMHRINSIKVREGNTLHIVDDYKGMRFVNPALCLGKPEEESTPGSLDIHGTVIVSGVKSSIDIIREGLIIIHENGTLIVENNASINATLTTQTDELLIIKGTLILDSIEQLKRFYHDNIVFTDTGKIIIKNKPSIEANVLLRIPNGIRQHQLEMLFHERYDRIEFHFPANNGIMVDRYYHDYASELVDWVGGYRIEELIKQKIFVFEDDSFIMLDNNYINWVNDNSTLYDAAKIFNVSGNTDRERLQNMVNVLREYECGNVNFIFVTSNESHVVRLNFKGVNVDWTIYDRMTDTYTVKCTDSGSVFLNNKLETPTLDTIVSDNSKEVKILTITK